MHLPLPDPPLSDGVVALRPWRDDDAPSLVAAWADEEIRCWTAVPPHADEAHARRWIAGEAERRRRRLALDLVVCHHENDWPVLGEVGLAFVHGDPRVASIGWWTAAAARGQGVASRAVRMLMGWAVGPLDLTEVMADIDPANRASVAVAEGAGFVASGPRRWCLTA